MSATLHELIELAIDREPRRVVLTVGGRSLTAAEFEGRANQVAHALLGRGLAPDEAVAVALPRGVDLVPVLLGVLKSGAHYVPIDPHLPEDRVAFMIRDARATCLIADGSVTPNLLPLHPSTLDVASPKVSAAARHRPRVAVRPDAAAYVIYTSGTTGQPKGVVVEHRNVCNLARGWSGAVPFRHGSVIGSLTTVAFDIFVAETFLPMAYGLTVALADEGDVSSPQSVGRFLLREVVDVLQVTPSRLSWLLADETCVAAVGGLELLVLGGEMLPPVLLERTRTVTRARIFNVYGPTETTVWTSAREMLPGRPVTIGPPIPGVRYLVGPVPGEPDNDAAADDEVDELLITGANVARGYLRRPELTSSRFLRDPDDPDGRLYRTGDRVRVLPDGEIQVLGRADDQIKIDGYRVELSELEAVLAQASGVRAAVATTIDTPSGRALAAAVDPAGVDVEAVWQHAATWCPRYMMPSTILSIDLPLAVSSKADRVRVREVLQQHVRGADLPDPWTYIRTTVSRWLGRPIALDDGGLLGVGLGSLGSARLVADLVFRYQVDLELSDALAAPTLTELARQVDRRAAP